MRTVSISALSAALAAGIALVPHPALTAPAKEAVGKTPPEIIASRAVTQKLGAALKTALEQAIETGGVIHALTFCHEKAGPIAADLGQEQDVLIGRTSLKTRNAANAPDNWELAVLTQFQARKEQGEPSDALEFAAVIEDDAGKKTFRYMKAIPTTTLCLRCHGENLEAEVDAKLRELYPEDQARGFKEGDLRGAFTLARPIP